MHTAWRHWSAVQKLSRVNKWCTRCVYAQQCCSTRYCLWGNVNQNVQYTTKANTPCCLTTILQPGSQCQCFAHHPLAQLAGWQGRSQGFQSGGLLRPEGPKAGVGFLGKGQPAPSPPVRGGAPAAQRFFYILSALDGFSCKQNSLSRRIFITIIYLFCTL